MTTTLSGTRRQAEQRAVSMLLAGILCLTPALASCSENDAQSPDSAPRSSAPAASDGGATAAPATATKTEVATIVGRLPGQRRRVVRKQVTRVLDRWWAAAYLDGRRPGANLRTAFPGFTIGARARARADQALTTNRGLRAESITPLMRKARLDLLAIGRRVRSVTARFDLRMRVQDQRTRRLQVRGRVFLTRRADGWRIFGYDVAKGWLR